MASKLDRFLWQLLAPAAVALSAAGWWFSSGVHPLWWLTWFAPLPVLWLAPRIRAGHAALAAFAAYAIGSFNVWVYLRTYIGLPLPVLAYAIGMPSLMLALCALLFRRLLRRGSALAAAWAVPAAWVACEYVNNLLSPHGTFFNIGYTQMDALALIQVAAVTGLWGIGFLVLLVPASIAALAAPRTTRRGRVRVAAAAALCLVAALAWGSWRLLWPQASTTMRIGLVSLQKPVDPALRDADGQALEVRYAAAIDRLADAGARIVLIPETSLATTDASIPAFAELARRHAMTVGAGIDFRGAPRGARNMLTVFRPGADAPATYSKHHLLIGMDSSVPGSSYTMLDGQPRIGLAICKDMDFHDIGWAYAARDAQLLLVPASDFTVDGWLHSRMAIMRGVESGFAIARAARNGRLTLSDDRGRVLAEASSERRDAELVGDLPVRATHTPYGRWGDWFALLDLALLAVLLYLAAGRVRTHRPKVGPAQ